MHKAEPSSDQNRRLKAKLTPAHGVCLLIKKTVKARTVPMRPWENQFPPSDSLSILYKQKALRINSADVIEPESKYRLQVEIVSWLIDQVYQLVYPIQVRRTSVEQVSHVPSNGSGVA